MAKEQVVEEKLAVQKALLQYENLHGRPVSSQECILILIVMRKLIKGIYSLN